MITLEQYNTKALWAINSFLRKSTSKHDDLFLSGLIDFLDKRDSSKHEVYMMLDACDGLFKAQVRELHFPCYDCGEPVPHYSGTEQCHSCYTQDKDEAEYCDQ